MINKKQLEDNMAVITMSRHFGAGGTTLGGRLSKRLGYRYVDDQLIKDVAKNVGVSVGEVKTFEKRGTSKLMKLLDWVVSPDFIERHTSNRRELDEKRYVEEVKSIILRLYEKDNVVIIGRGGNYALRGYPNTIHVLLVADKEHRIRFLADKYHMTPAQAERAIRRADMIRERFLNCFSEETNHDDPMLYTIILNMGYVSMDKAEDLIASLAQEVKK
ncbi:MAG: cytidylate kinase-like family protein [Deltaproteobacteria bacterium]|nr:cytidylate kinase-like family protein [Deltaproteobacteria bacterium]MBW1934460.1 cytidylate kinase-like family protein [Deltaproteobacteria bacterium]MBW1976923.1 cytidylate kinase-like family protein [Deltaproteobacteria bacterium]MBW2043933.1 cytidylate kinase-like family protein [Deltaproteobacteria bacterium]MBW2299605.1 cytidylate kinase-like family protein [Deltaproteobacteria bacterium]